MLSTSEYDVAQSPERGQPLTRRDKNSHHSLAVLLGEVSRMIVGSDPLIHSDRASDWRSIPATRFQSGNDLCSYHYCVNIIVNIRRTEYRQVGTMKMYK